MRRSIRLEIAIAALLSWLAVASPAYAVDVTAEEFGHLVSEAVETGEAGELATVNSIDGAPVDMTLILDGSSRELAIRLESLGELSDGQTRLDGDALRDQAQEIVSNPPFSAEVASDGSLIGRIIEFIGWVFSSTGARGFGLLAIAAIALVAGFLLLDRVVTRRRVAATTPVTVAAPVDYRSRAEMAASSGDFAGAVRFLFIDGAHSLAALKVVSDAETTTTATIRPLAGDDRFLDRFNEIAYGGDQARSEDVGQARRSWEELTDRFKTDRQGSR